MKSSGNQGWFGVSEGTNGMAPSDVIVRYGKDYGNGNDFYYEQGMKYQDKQMMDVEKGIKKQKLDRHF